MKRITMLRAEQSRAEQSRAEQSRLDHRIISTRCQGLSDGSQVQK